MYVSLASWRWSSSSILFLIAQLLVSFTHFSLNVFFFIKFSTELILKWNATEKRNSVFFASFSFFCACNCVHSQNVKICSLNLTVKWEKESERRKRRNLHWNYILKRFCICRIQLFPCAHFWMAWKIISILNPSTDIYVSSQAQESSTTRNACANGIICKICRKFPFDSFWI